VSSAASSRRYRIARSDQVGPVSRVKQPRLRRAMIEASSRERERERQAREARKKEGKEEKWKKLAMVVREQHYRQGTRCEFSTLLVFQSPTSESGHLRLSRFLALSFSSRDRRKKERPRAISNGAAEEFLSRKCTDRATGEDRCSACRERKTQMRGEERDRSNGR